MPLVNNKVGADGTIGTDNTVEDVKAQVDSLIKVVACYRHLASCVGGCTDGPQLRHDLRLTRERAQSLSAACCRQLTARLRDRSLSGGERQEADRLWVAFSSGLELLHADVRKVYGVGWVFPLANAAALVKTGIRGGSGEVTARALSVADLSRSAAVAVEPPDALEAQERCAMAQEIAGADELMASMEDRVNVLRWTVEPCAGGRGGGSPSPGNEEDSGGSPSSSLALLPADEERGGSGTPRSRAASRALAVLLLCSVVLTVAGLSVCVLLLS